MAHAVIEPGPARPPGAASRNVELRPQNTLRPVWLPALFVLAKPEGGLRLCGQPDLSEIMSQARSSEGCVHAQGPGFSGLLAFPLLGEVDWEFRTMWNIQAAEVEAARPRFGANLWQNVLAMWRGAPLAARSLALTVPLLVPALYFGPKADFDIHPTTSSISLTEAIRARATTDLEEHFEDGFKAWTGAPGWRQTWSVDRAGSAQPGRLALYSPSIPLSDYHLEFHGQIESKAMSFVFRAKDTNNYQAVKLTIRKTGPQQNVAMVRYAVIDGEEGPRQEFPLGLDLHDDTIYRLLVEVQGPHFTVTVNGQLVDAWSDDRLKTGGVGFFADKGEIARLRSVRVVDKQDFLGWVCSQVSRWTVDRRAMGVGTGVRHE